MSKLNGETVLIHPESGVEYRMRFDMNALADFEDATELNAMEALQDAGKLRASVLRKLFWCGLKQCHPDIDERTAGRMATMDALGKAFGSTLPDADKAGNDQAAA